MKKTALLTGLFVLACLFVAQAQNPIRLGVYAGYGTKIEKPALGIAGEIGIMENLAIAPSFSYYFLEKNEFAKTSFFEVNADAHYYFLTEEPFNVYGIGGLQIARSSVNMDLGDLGLGNFGGSTTKVGLNIGAGAHYDFGSKLLPFGELKYTIGGSEQLAISLGIKYAIR